MLSCRGNRIGWILCFVGLVGAHAAPQKTGPVSSLKIHISSVNEVIVGKWLGLPRKADFTVSWDIYESSPSGWILSDKTQIERFDVYCLEEKREADEADRITSQNRFATFSGKEVGKKYTFYIKAIQFGNQEILSDTAWFQAGKRGGPPKSENTLKWLHWFPLSGRFPLAIIQKARFFDESTKAGKATFHLIWNLFIAGVVIWLFLCWPRMRLSRIFPFKKGLHLTRGLESIYEARISDQFLDILKEWRQIVESANDNIRKHIQSGKSDMKDLNQVYAKFWSGEGAQTIRALKEKIKKNKLENMPAVKIILAGLENHELGGLQWTEVSKEVDRAIENCAASEMEKIRRKTLMDWLWNMGTLEPLLGLFGTATGISHAFAQLSFLDKEITQLELVRELSGGIYEALWTTIEGLAFGVTMMLLYYYYQNKLSWIYAKWEEIYIYVSEKL